MKCVKLSTLFNIEYGTSIGLNKLKKVKKQSKKSIRFISRTTKNNGVSAYVEINNKIKKIPENTISVALGGSVLESFLQNEPYYSGFHIMYLIPKYPMNENVLLYYCLCIKKNKYRYSYGRQANRTLKDLLIPDLSEIPNWVNTINIDKLIELNIPDQIKKINFENNKIKMILLSNIFNSFNGLASSEVKRYKIKKTNDFIPYIRPSKTQDNSIDGYVNKKSIPLKYIFPENSLYVSTDGQGSHTYSYLSTFEFIPNSNVTVLIPKKEMSLQEKLYYALIISKNRYKFSYGRKPKGERLKNLLIPESPPKWIFEKDFIKKLIKL